MDADKLLEAAVSSMKDERYSSAAQRDRAATWAILALATGVVKIGDELERIACNLSLLEISASVDL